MQKSSSKIKSPLPLGLLSASNVLSLVGRDDNVSQSSVTLLHFDRSTSLFELLLHGGCFVFRNTLLHRLGNTLNKVLCFFQPQPGQFSDNLDHLDLLVAEAGQNQIEFRLLLCRSSFRARSGSRHGHGTHRHRHRGLDPELLLKRLYEVSGLEQSESANLFSDSLNICHLGNPPSIRWWNVESGRLLESLRTLFPTSFHVQLSTFHALLSTFHVLLSTLHFRGFTFQLIHSALNDTGDLLKCGKDRSCQPTRGHLHRSQDLAKENLPGRHGRQGFHFIRGNQLPLDQTCFDLKGRLRLRKLRQDLCQWNRIPIGKGNGGRPFKIRTKLLHSRSLGANLHQRILHYLIRDLLLPQALSEGTHLFDIQTPKSGQDDRLGPFNPLG